MNQTRRGRLGFTLLELAITTVIFGIILTATMQVTLVAQSGSEAAMSRSHLDLRAQRALDLIVDEFSTAGLSALTPSCSAPLGSDHLTYRRPTGIAAGAVTWDSASSVVFEYGADDANNGLDDDGDGLVDEGRVVLVRSAGLPNETRTILCNSVPELMPGETANGVDDNGNGLSDETGLSFSLSGRTLVVRLSTAGVDRHGRALASEQSISLQLRN
jgi:prepilin-type N-terminal cleavage/methylation domain-containing protein